MKVYKLTCLFIDFDELGEEQIKDLIEGARLPNHISPPDVMKMESVDIGEWHDDNPLNKKATHEQEFYRLFPKRGQEGKELLIKYSNFLESCGYMDSDWWSEGRDNTVDLFFKKGE